MGVSGKGKDDEQSCSRWAGRDTVGLPFGAAQYYTSCWPELVKGVMLRDEQSGTGRAARHQKRKRNINLPMLFGLWELLQECDICSNGICVNCAN